MPFSFRSQATLTSKARTCGFRFGMEYSRIKSGSSSPGNSERFVKRIFLVAAAKLFQDGADCRGHGILSPPNVDQLFRLDDLGEAFDALQRGVVAFLGVGPDAVADDDHE